MRRNLKRLFLALLASGLLLFVSSGWAQQPKPKAQKPAAQAAQEEPEYTEEEYDAYEKASKETDPDKRLALVTAFEEKYPKSKLMPYLIPIYQTLMYEYNKNKNWPKLLELSEKWLKDHKDDAQAIDYAAAAAQNQGDHQKFLSYGEKVYALKPTNEYAYFIAQSYKKLGDKAKYLEWAEKALPFPPEDFGVRMEFVDKFSKEKKLDKAAEFAQLALKSAEIAKKPDSVADAEWQKWIRDTRRSCHYFIGLNAYEKGRWQEALSSFAQVLKIDRKYDPAHYYVGHCLWKQNKVEEAIESFAKATLLKGEFSAQAKEYLEKLYKALHNDTTIGIEKVYRRNEAELAGEKS